MDLTKLAALAWEHSKEAMKTQRARAGRTSKGPAMQRELGAAGSARQDHGSTFSYPRGHRV